MKKNIAIIIQKLNGGGAERTASNLSLLFESKYNVHLIVFDGREIKYPYDGVLHDLKLPPSKRKLGKILTFIKRIVAVKKIKRTNNIIAAISLMDGANVVNILSGINEKIITSVRIQMSQSRFNSKLSKSINKVKMLWIEKKSNYIVALSQGVKDDLINNFGLTKEKVITIYNPCDGEMLRQSSKCESFNIPRLSISTMGRFTEQKGQWHLIRAFSEVVKQIPEARLYILGDGPLKDILKKITIELGLSNNIYFPGYVEGPHAYIEKSKIFVFPSLYEGLGNVLLEAMACGTACISTDCLSGPREIIAPNTELKGRFPEIEKAEYGILVSVGDNDHRNSTDPLTNEEIQMANAIILLLQDELLQMNYSKKSLERSKDFLPSVIVEKWIKLIEE